MRILICFAILTTSVPSLLDAASASDVTLRISAEQKFITDAIEKHKSLLDTHISTTRTNLNRLADTLKERQGEAGKPCNTFITVIEGIQKSQINSDYYFRSCQLGPFNLERIEAVRDSFMVLLKTAEMMVITCEKFPSDICDNQIKSVNRNMDPVRKSVVEDLEFIETGVMKCVEDKINTIKKALMVHESVWRKCVENYKKWMDN